VSKDERSFALRRDKHVRLRSMTFQACVRGMFVGYRCWKQSTVVAYKFVESRKGHWAESKWPGARSIELFKLESKSLLPIKRRGYGLMFRRQAGCGTNHFLPASGRFF